MSLQTRLVNIVFDKGLDTRTDDKISNKPTRLENAVFNATGRAGTISKRPGTQRILSSVTPPSSADGAAMLGTRMVVDSAGTPYVASEVSNTLWGPGFTGIPSATVDIQPIEHNYANQGSPDHATGAGMSIYCWIGNSNEVKVLAIDEQTGSANAVAASVIDNSGSFEKPRCVYVGNSQFHVYYVSGPSSTLRLVIVTVTPGSPVNPLVGAPIALSTDCSTAAVDATLLASGNVLATWSAAAAGHFHVATVSPAGSIVNSANVATTDTNNIEAITACQDAANNVFVVVATTSNTYFYVYDQSLNPVLGSTLVATSSFVNVGACQYPLGRVFAVFNSVTIGGGLYYAVLNTSGVVSAPTLLTPNTSRVIGVPFYYSGITYIPVLASNSSTTVEPTLILLAAASGNIAAVSAARILPGLAEISSVMGPLRNVTVLGAGQFGLLVRKKGRSLDTSQMSLARAVVTFGDHGQTVQFEKVLFSAGAQPKIFDGQTQADVGFQQFLEGVSAAAPSGVGGLSAGTYQACAVLSWYDNNGQIYRSAPSVPVSFTATSGQQCAITIPALSVANALGPNSAIKPFAEVYRTQANGATFFKEGETAFNGVAFSSFSCSVSDATLASGELLYTTGGVLEAIAAPACKYVTPWHRRLVLAGLENPYEWRYSTKAVTNEFVRFNEVLNGYVPESKGKITAISTLDDKLVLFCEAGAWIVYGDGADTTGSNSSMSEAQPLPSDVGCDSWRSVVEIPTGLLFHSPKGWHLLGHDLSTQYLGAEVEAYNGYTVRSAFALQDQKQVRILCDQGSDTGNGACLVYDYLNGQWGVFPGYGGKSQLQFQGKYTRIQSDGAVLQETPGAYIDPSGAPVSLLETQWIHVAGIQGFQRVLNALFLGYWDGLTSYALTIDVGYDYDTSYDTVNDRFTVAVNSSNFSSTSQMQIRHKPRRQKCEAIRFRIQDGSLSSPYNGMSLTGMALEVGIKRGAFKLSAGRTV